jgi:hypothetical protein
MNFVLEIFNFEWIRIEREFLKKVLLFFIFYFSISVTAKDTGICYKWSEGDAQHLESCEASSLENCAKGKKKIKTLEEEENTTQDTGTDTSIDQKNNNVQ